MGDATASEGDPARIGKRVRNSLYLHRSARRALDPTQERALLAAEDAVGPVDWNVCRFNRDGAVGLLTYCAFDEEAFPRLVSSTRVSPDGNHRTIDYSASSNPLILHRKELLVSRDHPRSEEWRALTADLIARGLFRDGDRIGRLDHWNGLLERAGLDDQGHPA